MTKKYIQAGSALELRNIPRATIPLRNAFHGNRLPFALEVDGVPATFSFAGGVADVGSDRTTTINVRLGNDPASMSIDRALFDFLIKRFDDTLAASHPSAAHAALALEALLTTNLETLEKILGCPISIVSVKPDSSGSSDHELEFAFELNVEGFGSSGGHLALAPSTANRLAAALAKAPRGLIGAREIRFPVVACVASAHVSAEEAARLALGDVILVEHICDSPTKPFVIVADQLVFPAVFSTRGLRIEGPASHASGSAQEWCMEQQNEKVSRGSALDADVSQLPVKITFELGRVELSLKEVQALGQGTVIPLEKPLDQALDIMANGRRIGRGTIVKIGESIGVEITRITSGQ